MHESSLWKPSAYLLVLGLSLSVPCQAQVKYILTDLGTLGGSTSTAFSINASGQAVGSSDPGSGGFSKAFRTAPNSVIAPATDNLGNLGGGGSTARGINAVGQVAGSAGTINGGNRAFRTAPNQAINMATDNLGSLGGESDGYGINSSGQVVGSSYAGGRIFAFRTKPNASINPVTDNLGGGQGSYGYGINSSGQVVGCFYTGADYRAFRTKANAVINPTTDDLGDFGAMGTVQDVNNCAVGINDAGQAVGWSTTVDGHKHAFRTAPNAAINPTTDDLGTLGYADSVATSVNSSGQVVGHVVVAPSTGTVHAFIYSNGVMEDLNNLIPAGSGWILNQATSINDAGQIVGAGFYHGTRAFRLDPAPPVTTVILSSPPNANGWNKTNVTVTFNATSSTAGIQQINITQSDAQTGSVVLPGPTGSISITTEGTTTVSYFATDTAGRNETAKTLQVQIDKTPPTAAVGVSPGPNVYGWNNTNVTVSFTGNDMLSGINFCTGPITLLADGAAQLVSGTCTDKAGNVSAPAVKGINIDKIAPITTNATVNPNPVALNNGPALTATVSDAAAGGTNITSTYYSIDGGPSSLMSLTPSSAITTQASASLAPFTQSRVYNLCVHGTDSAGNTSADACILLPVYDPSGGFVTGGGWINSPPGGFPDSPSLAGKANFGFVSKYVKGATTPTGQTEFQFHVADFTFHSDVYEWLVVAGAKAQYKGTGTVNGTGNYGFLLTATDGELPGGGGVDKFRIKIWAIGGGLIYDNVGGFDDMDSANPQAIGGGNIVIQSR